MLSGIPSLSESRSLLSAIPSPSVSGQLLTDTSLNIKSSTEEVCEPAIKLNTRSPLAATPLGSLICKSTGADKVLIAVSVANTVVLTCASFCAVIVGVSER